MSLACSNAIKSGPQTVIHRLSQLQVVRSVFVFYPIYQSLEVNWRRGHYTVTRIETGNQVWCLQYDDNKIVTGQRDSTIRVSSYSTDVLCSSMEQSYVCVLSQ